MGMKLDLNGMTRQEKLIAMEALWNDLSGNELDLESPGWHQEALMETEAKVQAGLEPVIDWEAAKEQLRSRTR